MRSLNLPINIVVSLVLLIALPVLAAEDPKPRTATKEAPFVNSLGMKFVPVEITGGPTNGRRVLFSIWDTRVKDYEEFAKAKVITRVKPRFEQGPTHPVVMVDWNASEAFCKWLTNKERASGWIGNHDEYRLPSDHEWSCAVGIGKLENPEEKPWTKEGKVQGVYPWGTQWPPPKECGNYDPALNVDEFPFTSPVGAFVANENGLYDMGGNVFQWCEDYRYYELRNAGHDLRALRGRSWQAGVIYRGGDTFEADLSEMLFLSSSRCFILENHPSYDCGFRCVLEVSDK